MVAVVLLTGTVAAACSGPLRSTDADRVRAAGTSQLPHHGSARGSVVVPAVPPVAPTSTSTSIDVWYGPGFPSGPEIAESGTLAGLERAVAQGVASGAVPGSAPRPVAAVSCPATASELDVGEILGCSIRWQDGQTSDLFVKVSADNNDEFVPGTFESGESCDQLGTALWPAANELGMHCI